MKTLKYLVPVLFLFSIKSHAVTLEAKPVSELLQAIEQATTLTYKETGLIFGFHSIKSCLYTSDEMVVIKNYCFPKRKYPAKGYTIISPKFGIIDFYQEQLTDTLLKRDIRISEFPEVLFPYLPQSLKATSIAEANALFEKLYSAHNPSCWSTNFSHYSEKEEAKCTSSAVDVVGLDEWKTETQNLTLDEKTWLQVIYKLENQFGN